MAKPIPYLEESSSAMGELASKTWTYTFEPDPHPDTVRLVGLCPACDDAVDYPYPLGLVRSTVTVDRQTESDSDSMPIPVICRCKVAHPKANGERGCGRGWTLKVPRP
jgi:hypothetical protein